MEKDLMQVLVGDGRDVKEVGIVPKILLVGEGGREGGGEGR